MPEKSCAAGFFSGYGQIKTLTYKDQAYQFIKEAMPSFSQAQMPCREGVEGSRKNRPGPHFMILICPHLGLPVLLMPKTPGNPA